MMSDVENAEKCNITPPNSPSEPTEKLEEKETFIGSPEEADPTISEDGKPFVGIEGELDFEVLSPEKTERLEEQTFTIPNEADSQTSKTGESDKAGEERNEGSQHTIEKGSESKSHGIEDGEDDGECSEDEDLEEGEVKDGDETHTKEQKRQICRFFSRGTCFYGMSCRFLHLNNDMKGNYNMFSPTPHTPRPYEPAHMGSMIAPPIHRSAPRSGPDFMPVPPPLLPVPLPESESAWEKGLREAKELLKKAHKRKEEPEFNEKRLTMSLSNAERHSQINDKENDKGYKKKNRDDFLYKNLDPVYNRTPHVGRYENFEIRYTNVDRGMRSRRRNLSHGDRRFNQREDSLPGGHWRNGDRMEESRARGELYFDPWRRSKSPKHRRSKDRDNSRFGESSPFSSVSSYSSRTSSYSRSSSSMSRGSSRSLSPPPVNLPDKRYPLSPKDTVIKSNAVKEKKKPGERRNSRTRSYSRSRSRQVFSHSRTSSSRSRSVSRGRSVYSRSSRSLSMDSVSSASSSLSHSSSGESSGRPHTRAEHVSILRRQDVEKPLPAEREKPEREERVLSPPASNFYFQIPRPIKSVKETHNIGIPDNRDPLDESFQMSQVDTATFPPTMQNLIPAERERAKDPVKGLHPPKQQIKLTLLNKNPQKLSNLPKKEPEGIKGEEAPKGAVGGFLHGVKRPLSPPVPPAVTKPQPAALKKSASCRRDELLKQLKAVEDAIARKRAKFC